MLRHPRFPHRSVVGLALAVPALLLAGCGALQHTDSSGSSGSSGDSVTFAVSGPLTGTNAEYGGFWKKGINLAQAEINAAGGIGGKKLNVTWYDSQSDPKQSVTVAQKIVADDNVIAELGDFSSPASMAATPIYQRSKLVQYGFTNSSPDFTKGGSVAFGPTLDQGILEVAQADAVVKQGKRIAVLYQDTDWGKSTFDIFRTEAQKQGATLSSTAAYLPTSTDFRTLIRSAQAKKPDVLMIVGYDPDAAAIVKQTRQLGWTGVKLFTEQFSATAISLAGKDADGVLTTATWWPDANVPRVKAFVAKYTAKYGGEAPNQFEVGSYEAVLQLAAAAKQGGATRDGVLSGLTADKQLPSVQFGPFAFSADRRPPAEPSLTVVVRNGTQSIVK